MEIRYIIAINKLRLELVNSTIGCIFTSLDSATLPRRTAYQGGTFFIYTKAMGFPEHCENFGIFTVLNYEIFGKTLKHCEIFGIFGVLNYEIFGKVEIVNTRVHYLSKLI